jgi:guanylate kinase
VSAPDPAARLQAGDFAIVIAGPSGSGKTTIARELLKRRPDVRFSISATTRPPRNGEKDGEDYHFMTRGEFDRLIADGGLLEWAEVHGERYGTPRRNLREAERDGIHLLLDIDVQGAREVRRLVTSAVTIFLLPPSAERVISRLVGRGTEDRAALERRLRTAEAELAGIGEFDYVIVNDELEESIRAIERIVEAERRRVDRLREDALACATEMSRQIRRVLSEADPKA